MENRIDYWRKIAGLTVQQLADKAGIGRDYLQRLKAGKKRLNMDVLQRLADALGRKPADLISSENIIPISGIVSEGGLIHFVDVPQEFADCPSGLPKEDITAVRVEGDVLMPFFFDGWIIYYTVRNDVKQTARPSGAKNWQEVDYGKDDTLINRPCVIKLKDGRVMLKILKNGRFPNRYTLAGYNFRDLEDQEIEWAARIVHIAT